MKMRAFLLATSLLYAVPALALVDPPAAGKADGHVRSVVYDPNNPVQIFAVPGESLRIELGAVHLSNGCLSLLGRAHGHEAEAARTAAVTIHDDMNIGDFAELTGHIGETPEESLAGVENL